MKVVRVSDLARAKETADLIYDNMDLDDFNGQIVEKSDPDPLLNEGRLVHYTSENSCDSLDNIWS